jgi:hypothetical protein
MPYDRRYLQGHGVWMVGINFLPSKRILVAIAQFQDSNERRKSPLIMQCDRGDFYSVTLPVEPLPAQIDSGTYDIKAIPRSLSSH